MTLTAPARVSTDDCARRATTAAAPHRPGGDRRASARSDERLPDGGRQTAAEGREGFRTATCHMCALPTAPRAACSQIGPDAPPPPLAAAHWRPLPSLGTRGVHCAREALRYCSAQAPAALNRCRQLLEKGRIRQENRMRGRGRGASAAHLTEEGRTLSLAKRNAEDPASGAENEVDLTHSWSSYSKASFAQTCAVCGAGRTQSDSILPFGISAKEATTGGESPSSRTPQKSVCHHAATRAAF